MDGAKVGLLDGLCDGLAVGLLVTTTGAVGLVVIETVGTKLG